MRFWGVRGSIACPGPDTIRYGGNTSCVEIRCGGHLMIFHGGTGLRLLGNELMASGQPAKLDLFYSHTHFDHICGLPFFAPCYDARSSMRIWAGHLNGKGIETVLNNMMIAPLFPIPMWIFTAKMEFTDFAAGDVLAPHPGIRLGTGGSIIRMAPPAIVSNMAGRWWPTSPIPSIGRANATPCPDADQRRRCDDLRRPIPMPNTRPTGIGAIRPGRRASASPTRLGSNPGHLPPRSWSR